jgi:iron complex outermembrane receptor protein
VSSVKFPSPTLRAGRFAMFSMALLGVVGNPALSQTAPETPPDLPVAPAATAEVMVTAPRMEIPLRENPGATSVVGAETIQKTSSKTIAADEALKLVPGVKVDNQADGERVHISIRGQGLLTERGIRGIKVILDGLPLNDPTGFAPDLYDVDWATVRRVEVFRGPTSALWGGGGSGGVLNITTRDGEPHQDPVDVAGGGGSNGFWKVLGETGGVAGPMNYRVSASRTMGNAYRDHAAYYATNIYGKLGLAAGSSTRLTAIVAGTSFFNENPEGLNAQQVQEDRRMANPDSLTYNEYQQTRRATWGVSGETALTANQELSYALYYRATQYTESVPSTVQYRTFSTPGAFAQYAISLGSGAIRNHLSVGLDLDGQTIDETKRPNLGGAQPGALVVSDQTIRQGGLGVYLLDRVDLGPRWGAVLGVRWDRCTNRLHDNLRAGGIDRSGEADFDQPTGRLGVTWNPNPDLGLYASWGQGFIPPATEELANNPDAFGGFNPNLEPATSQGWEIGARGVIWRNLTWDVVGFRLNTEHDFGRYRVPGRPLETFYGNLGSSRRYGVETQAGWSPSPFFSAQLAYTWSNFKYTYVESLFGTYSDVYMPNSPDNQLYLDLQVTPLPSLMVGFGVALQTRSYVDASNLTWAGGYTIFNAKAAYTWKGPWHRGEVAVTLLNLTGKEYIAFTEPDPDGNSYQPAPTAQVFAGVRIWLGPD